MQNIKDMIENGFAVKRISKELNIPEKDVKNQAIQNSWTLRKDQFDDSKIDLICNLYSQGVSAKTLGIKFSIDKRRIQKWAKERDILRSKNKSHRFTHFKEDIFDTIDSDDKAYWLGFFYADAYNCRKTNTVTLSLQIDDKEHLEKLAYFVGLPKENVKYYKNKEEYEYYTLKMYSKHLCAVLDKLGCPQAKSFKIVYPDWLDKKYQSHFIRGMFDGDGCLTYREKQNEWKWSLVSTEMCCESIQQIFLDNLKIIINYHNISTTENNTSELETGGNEKIVKILNWLYQNSDLARLDRKYDKYQQLLLQQSNRRVKRETYLLSEEDKLDIVSKSKFTNINDLTKKYNINNITIKRLYQKENNFEKIIEIDNKPLTAKYISTLNNIEREKLIEPIFQYFRKQGWIYPDFTEHTLRAEYDKLKNCEIDLNKLSLNNNSSLATSLCKYFCHSFYTSTERDKKNMIELWNDDDALKELIKNRLVLTWNSKVNETFNISHQMMIQGMRSMRMVPAISMFKPAIAKYMALKYSSPGDIIGDYSCGFGGRLLGAVSAGRKYLGSDPLTAPELQKMIDFFKFQGCTLVQAGSEDYCGSENSIDLYWSSPPYYDQEYYSSDLSQAYNQGEDYFYNTYWKKTLENVKYMLKPGKWFGLNVKNYPKMLAMAQDYFGDILDKICLMTTRNHLNKTAGSQKEEYIYMFKNIK